MAVPLSELLNAPQPTAPYICYPLLPVGGRMVIGAQPKSFKSMLALNVAYDLAEGQPMFGIWKVTQPYVVLIVEQEIGAFRLTDRLRTIHAVRGGMAAAYNLYVTSKDLTVNLHTPLGLKILAGHIEQCQPRVLVLDPLRKLHRRRESESDDMVEVFGNLDVLQQKYDLSTIIVHHSSKRSEWRNARDPESLRGSSETYADVDTAVMVTQPARDNKRVIRLDFVLRSAQDPPPLTLRFDDATMTFKREGAADAS